MEHNELERDMGTRKFARQEKTKKASSSNVSAIESSKAVAINNSVFTASFMFAKPSRAKPSRKKSWRKKVTRSLAQTSNLSQFSLLRARFFEAKYLLNISQNAFTYRPPQPPPNEQTLRLRQTEHIFFEPQSLLQWQKFATCKRVYTLNCQQRALSAHYITRAASASANSSCRSINYNKKFASDVK